MSQVQGWILRNLSTGLPWQGKMWYYSQNCPWAHFLVIPDQVPSIFNPENVQIVNRLSKNQTGATTWPAKNVDINFVGSVWENTLDIIFVTTTVLGAPGSCFKITRMLLLKDSSSYVSTSCCLWYWQFYCQGMPLCCRFIWLEISSSIPALGPRRRLSFGSAGWQNLSVVRVTLVVLNFWLGSYFNLVHFSLPFS